MTSCKLIILIRTCMMHLSLILLIRTCGASGDGVPVFILDYNNVASHFRLSPNPLRKIGSELLYNFLREAERKSVCILLFVENSLSAEDLSLKDELGTPFSYLQRGLNEKRFRYLPSVDDPHKVLKDLFQPLQKNIVYLSSDVKFRYNYPVMYLYIYFQDFANATRSEILRNHDKMMREVYFAVKQKTPGPVVGIYTGKVKTPLRRARELKDIESILAPKENSAILVSDRALFRFSGVYTAQQFRITDQGVKPQIGRESWTRKKLSTSIQYADVELMFNFKFMPHSWLLESVLLYKNNLIVGRTNMNVGAPWKWSYICAEPLNILNERDGSVFTISRYQIQPRPSFEEDHWYRARRQGSGSGSGSNDGDDGDPTKRFGKSVNCGPYFNVQILSGLFITAICLLITSCGVVMLASCKPNDRYDDPNAKDIIIHSEGGQQ